MRKLLKYQLPLMLASTLQYITALMMLIPIGEVKKIKLYGFVISKLVVKQFPTNRGVHKFLSIYLALGEQINILWYQVDYILELRNLTW